MGGNDQGEPGDRAGVFGNLPASRPGTRSPRRDRADRPPEPAADEPTPGAEPVGPQERGPAQPPVAESVLPGGEGEPEPPDGAELEDAAQVDDEDSAGGLEDLAWAGVAAAAEAATIGVRLASRAMEALRESVDRR